MQRASGEAAQARSRIVPSLSQRRPGARLASKTPNTELPEPLIAAKEAPMPQEHRLGLQDLRLLARPITGPRRNWRMAIARIVARYAA